LFVLAVVYSIVPVAFIKFTHSSSYFLYSEAELRRRKRIENTTKQVQEIKRKQKDVEAWQELKRSLLKPLAVGVGVLLLGGGYLCYRYFYRA